MERPGGCLLPPRLSKGAVHQSPHPVAVNLAPQPLNVEGPLGLGGFQTLGKDRADVFDVKRQVVATACPAANDAGPITTRFNSSTLNSVSPNQSNMKVSIGFMAAGSWVATLEIGCPDLGIGEQFPAAAAQPDPAVGHQAAGAAYFRKLRSTTWSTDTALGMRPLAVNHWIMSARLSRFGLPSRAR